MSDTLGLDDLRCLARVAEGQGAAVPEPAVARLMAAGLVRRSVPLYAGAPTFELTSDGLARVRSSDQ